MLCFPHAKINVGLKVLAKRTDEFHEIAGIFYPVPVYDLLEAIPSDKLTIVISGLAIPGSVDENMCIRAWKLLKAKYGIGPVRFHLHKQIPTGAGLGGGSSDAVFTIRLLGAMFCLDLSHSDLSALSLSLGSDCPFFLQEKPARVSGRGEILAPSGLDLSGYFFVLVCPSIHISTAEAYARMDELGIDSTAEETFDVADMKSWKNGMKNDFERFAFEKYPALRSIKLDLYEMGAIYSSMSGSGSAIFGLFAHMPVPGKFEGCKVFTGQF